MEFTFENYIRFCKDFKLKPSRYKNLIVFKEYCDGDVYVVLHIKGDY